jgi:hypothetical protein
MISDEVFPTAGLTTSYAARRCVADRRVGANAVRISIPAEQVAISCTLRRSYPENG